jgi:hypothetical protein
MPSPSSPAKTQAATSQPNGPDPSQVQSEVMSFVDGFRGAIAEAWNRVESDAGVTAADPEVAAQNARIRLLAHQTKLANIAGALIIASDPNPQVALADIVALVSLQRIVLENPYAAQALGAPAAARVADVYREQERVAWDLTAEFWTPAQQEELRQLIETWRKEHPEAREVSTVRLLRYAKDRQLSAAPSSGRTVSLLSVLGLDPLGGLDPATRELERTRLLGERAYFYAQRVPWVLRWQMESLYMDLYQTPETQELLGMARTISAAMDRIATAATRLPEDINQQRAETLKQLFDGVRTERQETMKLFFDGMTDQRTSLVREIDSAQGGMQGTLKELRGVLETSNAASADLRQTIQAADKLVARFNNATPDGTPAASGNEDAWENYRKAMAQTADAADRLTNLSVRIDSLLSSPGLDRQPAALQQATLSVQQLTKQLIDHTFYLILASAALVPALVIISIRVCGRLVPPRAAAR